MSTVMGRVFQAVYVAEQMVAQSGCKDRTRLMKAGRVTVSFLLDGDASEIEMAMELLGEMVGMGITPTTQIHTRGMI